MNSTFRFQLIVYSIIGIILTGVFYSFNAYDFIELDKAVNITMRKLAVPIMASCTLISIIIYNGFIKAHEPKWYNSKILNFAKIGIRIIILSIGLSFISIIGALSFLIISNDLFGNYETFKFTGKVIKAWEEKSPKHVDKTYIVVKDENSDQIIELKVPRLYRLGSSFSKELKLGYWGLLYSKN